MDLDPSEPQTWPFAEVIRSKQLRQIDGLDTRFAPFVCGPYTEPPKNRVGAAHHASRRRATHRDHYYGVSSRLPWMKTTERFTIC